jgi:histidinol dehydrogenase
MTVQELTFEGLSTIGPVAITLAELEGLDAHAFAVKERLQAKPGAAGARR